jgi:DNA polymerase-3 subunit delta
VRIGTEQLRQHLGRELQPLYTVFGDETLLALEAADRIRAAARAQGHAEREVLTVEPGFNWTDLALAAGSQSLFAAKKILELRIPTGKPGTQGSDAIQAFCRRLPEDTLTLVQLPAMDWRGQKASWFEALESSGIAVEARRVQRKDLPRWLAGRLKAQGQEADAGTLELISERVEGNLMAAYQEVQKLALLFPAGKLEPEAVRSAVLDVARYDLDDLRAAVLEGDAARLARTLEGLKGEGAAPPLVLWALTEDIRALGRVVSAVEAGRPAAAAVRDARIYDRTRQPLIQAACAHLTLADVTEALRHAAAIDRTIKGLAPGDLWDEFLQLGLRFARPTRTGAAASV